MKNEASKLAQKRSNLKRDLSMQWIQSKRPDVWSAIADEVERQITCSIRRRKNKLPESLRELA